MAQAFTDNQLTQIDRAAERRVHGDEWRTAKPTKHAERVRDALDEYLKTPASFPLVVPEKSMQDTLEEQHLKHGERRFSGASITGFGGFCDEQ